MLIGSICTYVIHHLILYSDIDTLQGTAETYHWDEVTQNQILSAFFYGYLVTQIPGGWLAGKYGGKWLFGIGVLCTTVLTLLTPLAASAGFRWLIAVRVLEGLGEVCIQ